MTKERRLQWAQVLLFVTPAMWSLNYIVARASAGVVNPHLLALLRWSLALLIMLPFAWPALRRAWPHWRGEWRDALLLGALGMWICGAWVYQGGQTTSATNIGLLYAVSPVLIAAGSGVLFKEHLNWLQKTGVALALLGTLAVILKGQPSALLEMRFVVGDAWIIAAVISWTSYSLLLRKRPSMLDPFARLTVITMGGVLVLIPFTLLEIVIVGPPVWSTKLWVLAVVAAVFPGFASYQAYSFMQRELGIAKTGLVLYLGPLYAAGVAWWLLDEPVRWYHLLGAALILPGIYLATRAKSSAIQGPGKESR